MSLNTEQFSSSKRIAILGCCGAGKSTLAQQLHQQLKLPLIHIDQIYWQPDWTPMSTEDLTNTLQQITTQDQWIIDGNYSNFTTSRIARADTIIFLDTPRLTCAWRIIKRTFLHHGKTRPDMAEGCNERWDIPFIKYAYDFHKTTRPQMLEAIKDHPNVHIIA